MFRNFKKHAFTLAEVLITLAIIGTVAAMTVPTLFNRVKIDDKANDASLKKNIRAINDATKQIIMLDAPSLNMKGLTCTGDAHECLMSYYSKYISFAKTCKKANLADCLAGAPKSTSYKCKDASGHDATCSLDISAFPAAVVTDGTIMSFNFSGYNANKANACKMSTKARIQFRGEEIPVTNVCAAVIIDVNGAKKPNTVSIDRFVIPIGQFGIKTR